VANVLIQEDVFCELHRLERGQDLVIDENTQRTTLGISLSNAIENPRSPAGG